MVKTGAIRGAERIIKALRRAQERRDPEAAALSGGNLQKFIIGREIARSPAVLVVNQPTWGVDAGAAAAIRQALLDLAAQGSAVVVISQDLDELLEISDRSRSCNDGRSRRRRRCRGDARRSRPDDGRRRAGQRRHAREAV